MSTFHLAALRPARSSTATLSRAALVFAALSALLLASPLAADDDSDKDGSRIVIRSSGAPVLHLDCDEEDGDDCNRMIFVGGSGGFLGVEMTQLSPKLRAHFGAPENAGAMISEVVEDSPAEAAGLVVGDVIVSVDGEPVRSTGQLGRLIRDKDADTPVDIEIIRDHRAQVMRATLEKRERSVVDLGDFVGGLGHLDHLESLEHLEDLGPMISGVVAGTLESLDLESLGDAFEGLDFHNLIGANSFTLDSADLEEALESLGDAFESNEWQDWTERLESMDWSQFESRMEELKERMEALEIELESRHRDDDE